MTTSKSNGARAGHPIRIVEIQGSQVQENGQLIDAIFRTECSGAVIRGALPNRVIQRAVTRLQSDALAHEWGSPNTGMTGGEIRTIGNAATPTFTALRGPATDTYTASAAKHARWTQDIFGDDSPTPLLQGIFSHLFGGRPAAPPAFGNDAHWLPYNYRALDPDQQIYSHHDNHYGLEVYRHLDAGLDRSILLSWFVTLQAADDDGKLIVYGLWGSDPNPPMLPTRFLDTAALERDFEKHVFDLRAGDLVIFDAGHHVHRVSTVLGGRPRLTFGGFMTADVQRTRLAFWG